MPVLENRLFTCDEAFLAPVFHLCTDVLSPADAPSAAQDALPPENGAVAKVDNAVSDCPASEADAEPDSRCVCGDGAICLAIKCLRTGGFGIGLGSV